MSFLYLRPQNFNQEFRRLHLKKNQLDVQFIFNIFRQALLHVSGVSIAHYQEVHRTDTTISTYCSL